MRGQGWRREAQLVCATCGRENLPSAAFCVGCGQALVSTGQPGAQRAAREPTDRRRLVDEALGGARRLWPALGLIGLAGLFDFHLNGQVWFPLIVGGAGAAIVVFARRLQAQTKVLNQFMPARFVTPVLASVTAALLYLIRWSGTQGNASSLLTALLIAGFGIGTTSYRTQINSFLTPVYEVRDRYLPKPVRIALMFVVPVFLTFLIAHQNLGDIGALFGASTGSPRSPATTGGGFRILLTTVLSASLVFVLLNEPQRGAADARA